jgi:3-oxoacyl-(acyl-carrier-protein) synthase
VLEELRRTARFIQFAVVAAMEAVQKSGLDIESIAPMCGVEIGSGMGGIEVLEEFNPCLVQFLGLWWAQRIDYFQSVFIGIVLFS